MLAGASPRDEGSTGRQRLSGVERRAAIVRSAMTLFAERGLRGTTTRELAAAAGISEPVLYQHFATKSELHVAIVDHMVEEASRRFGQRLLDFGEQSDDQRFFEYVGEIVLGWFLDHPEQIRLMLFSALERHELAELWHEKATVQFQSCVQAYVERRVREGDFRAEHLESAAYMLPLALAHFGMVCTVFGHQALVERRSKVVRDFVDIYLNGVRTAAPAGGK